MAAWAEQKAIREIMVFLHSHGVAMKVGVDKAAMVRVRAGISYALTEAMNEGHCGMARAVRIYKTYGGLVNHRVRLGTQ